MKTDLKKLFATIMIIIMIITISLSVTAADDNYSVGMSLTSNSKLKAGDTVTVNINLTSVNAGAGIDVISAELNFDKNVFETPSASSFSSSTAWTPSYAPSTNMMTFVKNDKVKAAETVATISLKVKANISAKSTTVTIKDIIASGGSVATGGTGDITVSTTSVTINADTTSTGTTDTSKPNTSATKTNTVKDKTTTKTSTLPKTGIGQLGIIVIIVLAGVGIFSYALYKKTDKYVK